MPQPLLSDLIVIFALCALAVWLGQRFKQPAIVGFLLAGLLAGPHGLGLVTDVHTVEAAAELGVVLLMFTIGMEFSFRNLLQIRRSLFWGGSVQVGLTVLAGVGAGWLAGRGLGPGLFWGFLAALSSTAIVLKLWQERAGLDSPPGRVSLAILIFQDLVVIPMMLAVPLLAGQGLDAAGGQGGWLMAAKGVGVMALLAVSAKWLVPWALDQVAATRNNELFLVAMVFLCLAVAGLTSWAGLSLALGAFLAGLIISESPYSHQALGHLLPLRDIFTSLFFVSIGMLLDFKVVAQHPLALGLATLAVVAVKGLAAGAAVLALGLPLRVAVPAALGLAQVGEFSFILAEQGRAHGLLGAGEHQWFLVVSVLSMSVTPMLLGLGSRLGARLGERKGLGRTGGDDELEEGEGKTAHGVLVVGFGINGQNVARACQAAGIPYLILEMNPETVRRQRELGEAIVYGDAMRPAVLEHFGARRARVLVVTMTDPVASRSIVATARALNPDLYVIVRTRFAQEMEQLRALGADEVIVEEYETALEIFTRVLRRFWVPRQEMARLVEELRSEGYEMLRGVAPADKTPACDIRCYLGESELETLTLRPGSPLEGLSIAETELRKRHGVTVLALRRGGEVISNPEASTRLAAGDLAVLMGPAERLAEARELFRAEGGEGISAERLPGHSR
jgi:CPA2 family monovalent cation:H+ antiporter-2